MNIRNNKGVALVITLLVLTLLIVLILEFSQGMRVEARAAANFRDEIKAYYLARSGVTFAIAVLEDDKNNPETKDVDSLNETWAQKLPPIPLGDGYVSVEIVDESSKINVNKLGDVLNHQKWYDLISSLLEHLEIKKDIVEALSDWIDTNINGEAESSYYEGLPDAYEAKNNLLDSLQELRLIKDIDDDTFGKLRNFLTVLPKDDSLKININTASKEVLTSLFALSNMLSDTDTADDVINSRTENPFSKPSDLREKGLMEPDAFTVISPYIAINSNYFSITSTGEVNQIRKKIHTVIKRDGTKTNIIYWRVE